MKMTIVNSGLKKLISDVIGDEMSVLTSRFANVSSQIKRLYALFSCGNLTEVKKYFLLSTHMPYRRTNIHHIYHVYKYLWLHRHYYIYP